MLEMKRKVCMVGDEAVGKTSLVRRFVYDIFDEAYIRTVGTMISKREVVLPELDFRVDLVIWDIMGRKDFMELFKEAYFNHAKGIIAVFDLTMPRTMRSLDEWLGAIHSTAGEVPTVVIANKVDLEQAEGLSNEDIQGYFDSRQLRYFKASAKSGKNVDEAVSYLAREMLEREERGGRMTLQQPLPVASGPRKRRQAI